MRLPCPCCGERDLQEFTYLGDATLVRPPGDATVEEFAEYVYLRDNPAGPHRELWYHAAGCRAWLVVTRDTRTHAIEGVELARDAALERPAAASSGEPA
jgi:methylglutamate dehydrogenase subunit B